MKPHTLGISLSGGGYRASAFHLGTLKKLHELGILQKAEVLSTISGGSITGAAWCLSRSDYKTFHDEMVLKLKTKSVIRYIFSSWIFIRSALFLVIFLIGALILTFTCYAFLAFPVLIVFFILFFKFQYSIFPVSKVIEKAYDDFFYKKSTLKDLKPSPILAIGSSNLHTGRPFTFSQKKMSDSSYVFREEFNPPIYFKHENFPVARAVMASSCVPFAFTPISIDQEFYADPADYKRIRPMLVDGGVYDNQGIQKLTQVGSSYACEMVITSDAGGNFVADKTYTNVIALLLRTVDLFMYRIKTFQMSKNLYQPADVKKNQVAYLSLGWRIQNCIPGFVNNMINNMISKEILDAHRLKPEWIGDPAKYNNEIREHLEKEVHYKEILSRDLTDAEWEHVRVTETNLRALPEKTVNDLIRHAENLTELQVRLYCPGIL